MENQRIIDEIDDLKSRSVLSKRDRKRIRKLEKRLSKDIRKRSFKYTGIIIKIAVFIFIGVFLFGGVWYWRSRPNLPPITMDGHVEQNPAAHILNDDIPEPIQKHMLEHADADDKLGKGIIIHYNCGGKYQCNKDLRGKLESMAKKYPNVYVAPGNYDGKIILTKLGEREILNQYDEKKIADFIEK